MTRNVFITGGAKGIGASLVRDFARAGYTVAFCYKTSKEKADSLVSELNNDGFRSVFGYKCDVSDFNAVESLYKELEKKVGFVDTIVNNAAVSHYGLFSDLAISDYEFVLNNNFKSVFNVCRIFSPKMVSNSFGRIINVGSIFGEVGGSMEVLYSASKAAISGLSKALAKELAPSGVTVNVIAPGLIDTDMNSRISDSEKAALIEEIPVGRIGTPHDVSSLAVFLASEDASFITAQTININGGSKA